MMGGHGGDDNDDGDSMTDMMTDMTSLAIEKVKYFALVPVFFGAIATLAVAKGIVGFIFALYTIIAVVYSFKAVSDKSNGNRKPVPVPLQAPVTVPASVPTVLPAALPVAASFPSFPYEYTPQSVPYEYSHPNIPMHMPFNQWRH